MPSPHPKTPHGQSSASSNPITRMDTANTPDQPPNTTTPTPAKVEENYWPNIDKWLSSRPGPEPVAHCSICMTTKLDIPLLHGKPPRAKEDAWEVCHDFPCGHIVGAACADRWVRDYLGENPSTEVGPRCPICRRLIFPDNQRAAFARLEVPGEFWLKLWIARLEDNQMEEEEDEEDEEMENASDESGDSDDLAAPGVSRALLRPAGVALPSNVMDLDSDSD